MEPKKDPIKDIVNCAASKIPEMLTIRETANRTGVSYDAIRKLCLQNKIVYIRAGKKFLVNFDKFCEYLNAGEKEGADRD